MRINKYIAWCGVTSRRQADELIKAGQVSINGQVINKLGVSVDPDQDIIAVAGRRCRPRNKFVYIALNKPKGYVCTHARFKGEKSIFELLPDSFSNLKIAGRLDKTSEGLVLLSDDGDFIQRLTHPRYKHEKEYEIKLDNKLTDNDFFRLEKGIRLDEGIARADKLRFIGGTSYRLIIHQGWKRQIRRMMERVGQRIILLKRIREANMRLLEIKPGKFIVINRRQVI